MQAVQAAKACVAYLNVYFTRTENGMTLYGTENGVQIQFDP